MDKAIQKALQNLQLDDPLSIAGVMQNVQFFASRVPPLQKTLQTNPNIPKRLLSIAASLYNKKRFTTAAECFLYLFRLDHTHLPYILGLGGCHQNMRDYLGAIAFYTYGAAIAPNEPKPYFYAAEVSLGINKIEAAKYFYGKVMEVTVGKSECAKMRERAEALLNSAA